MVRVGIHEHARDGRPLTIESAQNTYVVSDDLPKLCCSLHPTMKLDDWICETAGGGSVHCASPRVFNNPVLPNLFSTVRRTTMSSPVRVRRCSHGPVHIRPRTGSRRLDALVNVSSTLSARTCYASRCAPGARTKRSRREYVQAGSRRQAA